MKKRLIEWDLPLSDISEESAREKNIRHGHPSTLHIWWARRPLASSRATAFAALIDDPGEENPEQREYLKDLIRRITPWEAVKDGNSEAIEEARELIRKQYGRAPRVLDPFAGGGSIPLEALRLGCETYASDYNPVAILIQKATIEWPHKFGIEININQSSESIRKTKQLFLNGNLHNSKSNLLIYLLEKWATVIYKNAQKEIGDLYPTEPDGQIPVGFIWGRTIECQNPNCKAEIPLIRQYWLSKKRYKKTVYKPIIDKENRCINFSVIENFDEKISEFDPNLGTVIDGDVHCLVCGQIIKNSEVQQLARDGKMGERLIAVILSNQIESGKNFRVATTKDRMIYV